MFLFYPGDSSEQRNFTLKFVNHVVYCDINFRYKKVIMMQQERTNLSVLRIQKI